MSKLLKLPDLIEITGMSRSTILRMIDEGKFPRPIKLNLRTNAWVEAELKDWVNSRIAERELV